MQFRLPLLLSPNPALMFHGLMCAAASQTILRVMSPNAYLPHANLLF